MRRADMHAADNVRADERDKPAVQAPLGVTVPRATVRAALTLPVVAPARISRVREAVRW
ncbi:hypothetical protein [Streptomyces canus]|uniref:hypothetical protein n=1 Tax=Streptomyces canus TaxID=58343 RepID=UPI0027826561|nr:hypothetical protein [Streptomyces canus]MDQ0765015.1 hypothetical protein [Streptomyces canus]MDQ1066551.1 hypothetical protein [Streptomyces canus]